MGNSQISYPFSDVPFIGLQPNAQEHRAEQHDGQEHIGGDHHALTAAGASLAGSLVQRCLAGDQDAWSELVNSHRRLVYTVASRFGATPDDCADIFQSVCIELFNGLAQVKNEDSLRSWLITVTVRLAFRWRRSQPRYVMLDDIEMETSREIVHTPDLNGNVWKSQRQQMIHQSIDRLPSRAAEMLRLLFFEQPPLPYQEVARRLGLATGSIGFIRGRALNKLRKILNEAGCDGL
ncbi:MAG: RNA polymerase sigma factor [Actinomycetota bacterium]